MEQSDVSRFALAALRLRITKVFPDQIRLCLEDLDEQQLWWRPNSESNSIANLVLHLRGSVLHFLYRGVGGMEYQRDRPTEFSTRAASKEELLSLFDDMVEKATLTFSKLEPGSLGDAST